MSLLFESIKITDGTLFNIDYHNNRVNESRRQLFEKTELWDLRNFIKISDYQPNLPYKCKVVYAEKIFSIDFLAYSIRPLRTLKLIECPTIEYKYKYFDRKPFDILKQANPQTDDIIIVKNQRITDCTYANIVFFDGEKWITPGNPLLKGTKRQKYIDEQLIFEDDIKISDLKVFTKARIINAMIDLNECPDILLKNIFY